jgi:flagellar hook-associated protein 3 FlgL
MNANDPSFQTLAQAYTMLAEFEGSQLSAAAQQAVASTAASLVATGLSALTNAQAALRATQSAVSDANDTMSRELTILQKQIGSLDSVDPAATAARISSLTTEIQMAYELTARLQQLNLAQYLPVT